MKKKKLNRSIRDSVILLIVDKLDVDISEVTEEAALYNLGADSLDLVEILIDMEKYFAIAIPISFYDAVNPAEITVGEIIAVVEKYVKPTEI